MTRHESRAAWPLLMPGAMKHAHLFLMSIGLALPACSGESTDAVGPDAAAASDCDGTSDQFAFTGAISAEHVSFGFTKSNGKIVGTGGAAHNSDLIAFNLRDLQFELETLGDHDVAVENLTALRGPLGASCEAGNTVCHGFFALAGTFTVEQVIPRYRARFTLSDLRERNDNFSPPGAAIAGTIAGCIDKSNP